MLGEDIAGQADIHAPWGRSNFDARNVMGPPIWLHRNSCAARLCLARGAGALARSYLVALVCTRSAAQDMQYA